MYVITGITGQVGGTVARTLLAAGKNVRAVVRDASRGGEWLRQGCELALADMRDAAALTRAFKGAEAVFVLLPPNFDPSPDFLESRYIVSTLRSALETAQPAKVVCLSTIGAQASQSNLLRQLSDMEQQLGQLPMPVAFLRAGWFMENSLWDIAPARDEGVLHSFLQPLDKAVPMVATADVGRTAAMLLQESWQGVRIVELEGPRRVTPQHLAATLGRLLGRDVQARSVPRDTWEQLFRSQGMHNPLPRMQMLDGFNQGWIDFAGTAIHGTTKLETVLADLIQRQA